MTDDPGVIADLFALICQALEAAADEFEAIEGTPVPAPDAVGEAIGRGEVAEAVLRRICRAAPLERRRRLGAIYREEWALRRRCAILEEIKMVVLPEVKGEVDAALEAVRRAALVDPVVRGALEEVRR